MKYAYFPGCSAESTARDLYLSTVAVTRALGIEFAEPEAWSCCGTTMAHQVDHDLSLSLAAANLLKVKDMGLDMAVSCASCYSRMKIANHEISMNPKKREIVAAALGRDYDGTVKVRHFVEIVIEDIGLDAFKKALTHSLGGLKVASYYGCLMVRPPEVAGLDDPENPVYLDRLINAMGGVGLDWPHKVECCGGSLTLTRSDLVVKLSESIIAMAKDSGAECLAVACPMCQINLDMRQDDIFKATGRRYDMPVIYISQLMGSCLGMSEDVLGLDKKGLKALRRHFYFAGSKFQVLHALGPGPDRSFDTDYKLLPEVRGFFKEALALRLEDDLRHAVEVAQVNENQPAMVPPGVHPAAELDGLAGSLCVELAAGVRPHRCLEHRHQ